MSSSDTLPAVHELFDQIARPLLSNIAENFQEHMTTLLSDQVRGGSTYKGVFTGREAVDQLAIILKTSDRQLALFIGRSLGAQGLFSDAKSEQHAFEDSEEIYQFGGGSANVTGVWTLLTKCYSPSCSKDSGRYSCYSCICPHGVTAEQQSRY